MLKNLLKKWLGVSVLEAENLYLRRVIASQADRITDRIAELDKLTAMDVDVGFRGPCTIILSGVFHGRGYVSFYDVDHKEFQDLVNEFKYRRKLGHLRNVDNVPRYAGGSFEV